MNENQQTGQAEMPAEDKMTIDLVTGLRNEHLFRLRLPDEFYRARDKELNGALLIIKLDKIIEINARHGRSGGDEALRAVSNLLKKTARESGKDNHLIFKLSGPFFGYFIRSCTDEYAFHLAQKLVQNTAVSELFIEKMTISIGLINLYEFFMRHEELSEIAELIEKTAMLRVDTAEKSGGNTVCRTSEILDLKALNRQTVLIIDPEQSSLSPLKKSLEAADYTVETCRDGETAFALINARAPGVIICEAMTPVINGFMLRDRLLRNVLLKNIPFILMSHKKNDDFIQKAIVLDIRFFFRKPVSVLEITGLVKNILEETKT